jgi:hypothetical protein
MKNEKCLIWVTPDFKRKLKVESAERGISIMDYTKMLSRRNILELEKTDHHDKKRKRDMFDFGF